jgi:hypothetical protein
LVKSTPDLIRVENLFLSIRGWKPDFGAYRAAGAPLPCRPNNNLYRQGRRVS